GGYLCSRATDCISQAIVFFGGGLVLLIGSAGVALIRWLKRMRAEEEKYELEKERDWESMKRPFETLPATLSSRCVSEVLEFLQIHPESSTLINSISSKDFFRTLWYSPKDGEFDFWLA